MTNFIKITCISLLMIACSETKKQKITTPPNVVIIFTDDQGYQDLGSFGSPNIKTPHLDQMAKEGTVSYTHLTLPTNREV